MLTTSLCETQPDQNLWLLRRVNTGAELDGLPSPKPNTLEWQTLLNWHRLDSIRFLMRYAVFTLACFRDALVHRRGRIVLASSLDGSWRVRFRAYCTVPATHRPTQNS